MRYFICFLAGILAVLCICAYVSDNAMEADAATDRMFEEISREHGLVIMYDTTTGVMYSKSNSTSSTGVLTLLVNQDGTPRIWEGYTAK